MVDLANGRRGLHHEQAGDRWHNRATTIVAGGR